MDLSAKRTAALAALDNHARRYGVTIPDRLRQFYAGAFDRYQLMYCTGEDERVHQVALTPPTWLDKDDDAINGPEGEWEDAKHYLPVMVSDQAMFLVADLRDPGCPVGWYEEPSFGDGVQTVATSLDQFLAGLTATAGDTPEDEVFRPQDPDQDDAWAENFADDSPRAFDAL
ncbi:hypothetical protein BH11MYX2_BH11MYX2_17530 [soil metagenome]